MPSSQRRHHEASSRHPLRGDRVECESYSLSQYEDSLFGDVHKCLHRPLTFVSQDPLEDWGQGIIIVTHQLDQRRVMQKTMKVLSRSVTTLALGMALVVGSAGLASASMHHDNGSDGNCASGRILTF